MKKFLIVTSSTLAIFGLAWCGATWYTGYTIKNNLESHLKQQVAFFNERYPNNQIQIEYQDYYQGIFSSKLTLKINQNNLNPPLSRYAPNPYFLVDVTLHHGPFPIPRLKEKQLAPQFLTFEALLKETNLPLYDRYVALSENPEPVTLQGVFDFEYQPSIEFNFAPLKYQRDEKIFTISGIAAKLIHIDPQALTATALVEMDYVHYDNQKTLEKIHFNTITFDATKAKITKQLTGHVQSVEMLLNNASMPDTHDTTLIEGVSINALQTPINDSESDIEASYAIDHMRSNTLDMGQSQIKLAIQKAPWAKLKKQFIEMLTQISNNPGQEIPLLAPVINTFLTSDSKFSYVSSLTKEGQQSLFDLNFEPSDNPNFAIPYLKRLDLNMSVYLPQIIDYLMPPNFVELNDDNANIAWVENKEMMVTSVMATLNDFNQGFNMLTGIPSLPLFMLKNKTLKTTLNYNYAEPQTKINGQKLDNEKIEFILQMLLNSGIFKSAE